MSIDLSSPFTSKGLFRRSKKSRRHVSGRLVFTPPDVFEIELDGLIPTAPSDDRPTFLIDQYPVIYGHLSDGQFVSLWECLVTNRRTGSGPVATTTILVGMGVIGTLSSSSENKSVKEAVFSFSWLEEWAGFRSIKPTFRKDDDRNVGVDITYSFPEPAKFEVHPRNLVVVIEELFNMEDNRAKFTMAGTAAIRIFWDRPVSLATVYTTILDLKNLLTLLMGERLNLRFLNFAEAKSKKATSTSDQDRNLLVLQDVIPEQTHFHQFKIFLDFPSVKASFGDILNRWFAFSEQLKLAVTVYFSNLYHGNDSINVRYIGTIHALEAYNRASTSGLYMPVGECALAIEALKVHLPSYLDEDHCHSLRNRLKYGNQYSLRKRLQLMLQELPTNIRERIAGSDFKRFSSVAVDTRNYYTHFDKDSREEVFADEGIYYADVRLKALFICILLRDLGVEFGQILEGFRRNQRFSFAMSQPFPKTKKGIWPS